MLNILQKCLEAIVSSLVVAIVVIVCIQVFSRYTMEQPFVWSEEFITLSYQWLSLLGSALAVRYRAHFGVDIAVRYLGVKSKIKVDILGHIIIWIMGLFMMFYGYKVVINSWVQMYPTLPWSYGVGYSVVPIAGLLFWLMDLIVLKEKNFFNN